MKKITITLLVFILFACKKEHDSGVKNQPLSLSIPPPIITYTTAEIPNSIKSSLVAFGSTNLTFLNTFVTATITPVDNVKSNVVYKANGKSITAIFTKTVTGILTTNKLASASGQLYYSFVTDTTNVISNLVTGIEIPFSTLSTVTNPITPTPYLKCMQSYIAKCSTSFWCKLTFGTSLFGITSAGIGWSIGCAFGQKG